MPGIVLVLDIAALYAVAAQSETRLALLELRECIAEE
jgi:hypothetical protein